MARSHDGRRVAIVDGVRTPFARQGSLFRSLSPLELGKLTVSELLQRTGIAPSEIDRVVFGHLGPATTTPNFAREIVLASGMSPEVDAYTVSRACASGHQAVVNVAESIAAGAIDCGLAGGADGTNPVPRTERSLGRLAAAFALTAKARSLRARVRAVTALRRKRRACLLPAASSPTSIGFAMGESAERMAREQGISRELQDEFAHRSHRLADRAWQTGLFSDDVMHVYVPPDFDEVATRDNGVRRDSRLESYAKLKPLFDARHGTVTVGNTPPAADGAATLMLMAEEKARALGFDVLGFLRSSAFTALDPNGPMLLGPVYATMRSLKKAGLAFSDLDLIDMHEASAAQVLGATRTIESDAFGRKELGLSGKLGEIDWSKFNVNGGSIALGHPFAATGVRQILQTLRELKRRGGEFALCTACAAGGIGAAIVLEAA